MKKHYVTAVLAAITLSWASASQAQFGNLLGGIKPAAGAADIGTQQDRLVRSYVSAGRTVLTANGYLAQALGIKTQSINATATADALSAKDIEAQDKAISADAAAVSEALKAGATLKDAEAQANFAKGLASLALGVKQYLDMRKDVDGFASGLSGASPLQLTRLQSGVYVVKTLPTSVSNLTTVLRNAVEFARINGIDVPKDATSLL